MNTSNSQVLRMNVMGQKEEGPQVNEQSGMKLRIPGDRSMSIAPPRLGGQVSTT